MPVEDRPRGDGRAGRLPRPPARGGGREGAGVPEPQSRTPGVPSGTNLIGLVKHLTHVERHWLLGPTGR
ncbi:DUF664 domain-containing protein [Amycolatopsis methanolica]|uniref:mycothiol transferase n=1 Tax=Amycolatopsis methanolica TaxID=1814 RepID=UPI003F4E1FA1